MSSASSSSSSSSESAMAVWKRFGQKYAKETSPQVKVIDSFLGCALLVGAIQFVYCAAVGTFPFNSFLSGLIAAIGVFVLTVSLRLQVVDVETFKDRSPYQAFAEYCFCCIILFLAVLNFMG